MIRTVLVTQQRLYETLAMMMGMMMVMTVAGMVMKVVVRMMM